jgi:hypothetical protein
VRSKRVNLTNNTTAKSSRQCLRTKNCKGRHGFQGKFEGDPHHKVLQKAKQTYTVDNTFDLEELTLGTHLTKYKSQIKEDFFKWVQDNPSQPKRRESHYKGYTNGKIYKRSTNL